MADQSRDSGLVYGCMDVYGCLRARKGFFLYKYTQKMDILSFLLYKYMTYVANLPKPLHFTVV